MTKVLHETLLKTALKMVSWLGFRTNPYVKDRENGFVHEMSWESIFSISIQEFRIQHSLQYSLVWSEEFYFTLSSIQKTGSNA